MTVVLHPQDAEAHHYQGVHTRKRRHGEVESLGALRRRYHPGHERFALMRRFANQFGLEVVEASAVRHDVILSGSVANLERAFGVKLHRAQGAARPVRMYRGEVHLPHEIADIVDGVLGLDSVPHHSPRVSPGGLGQAVSPEVMARHYGFPAGRVRGGRIALLQFGGGYSLPDIRAFAERVGVAIPRLAVRAVPGGDGTTGRNAPLARAVLRRMARAWISDASFRALGKEFGPSLGAFFESLEATMDVQLATAFGGGAPIDVVFAPPCADGWRRALYAVMGQPYGGTPNVAAVPLPTVLSISWGSSEKTLGAMKVRVLNKALTALARRGVMICASSGDRGSTNTLVGCDGVNVNFPASSPVVVAVGGTRLEPRGDDTFSEVSWKGALKGGALASGGGMSGLLPKPLYQQALRTPGAPGTWRDPSLRGDGRWLPDVAASAAFECGVELVVGGTGIQSGGTSAATPIVAALLTRVRADFGRALPAMPAWLYSAGARSALTDITEGDNDVCARSLPFYRAGRGWDACTGHGVPSGTGMGARLRATAAGRVRRAGSRR